MIDKQSPIPIYYQLEQYMKEKIEKGEWQPGEMIPSERELAEMYDISRMTVRQAVNNLVNDGYLIRRRGKGTFVAAQKNRAAAERADELFRRYAGARHGARHDRPQL